MQHIKFLNQCDSGNLNIVYRDYLILFINCIM